ncbi:hypothetical protein ABZ922_44725 [Streptomyces shenzhenensis]|uniref:hypothetical protein n=1 Tax=Streptomyces shenzhenensis TaxID=943815 RepID=UPI00340F78F6
MSSARPGPSRAGSRTITGKFHVFHDQNPHAYRALEHMSARRIAAGTDRVGMKDLFEDLRRQLPYGVAGLNNDFTALYARQLIAAHSQ